MQFFRFLFSSFSFMVIHLRAWKVTYSSKTQTLDLPPCRAEPSESKALSVPIAWPRATRAYENVTVRILLLTTRSRQKEKQGKRYSKILQNLFWPAGRNANATQGNAFPWVFLPLNFKAICTLPGIIIKQQFQRRHKATIPNSFLRCCSYLVRYYS